MALGGANPTACEGAVAAKRATVVGMVVALGVPLVYHLMIDPLLLAVGIGVLLSLLVPVLSFAAHALAGTGEGALVEVTTGGPCRC